MVVDGGGLQRKTVTSILMAWVFTLPAAIILSGGAVLAFTENYLSQMCRMALSLIREAYLTRAGQETGPLFLFSGQIMSAIKLTTTKPHNALVSRNWRRTRSQRRINSSS
nr:low-affinity inorganic phosphate transporter [Salmonella sp. NCTC 7297]